MEPITNARLDWQASTPLSTQFSDPYFSLADGLAETEYVFLGHNDLPKAWQGKQHFVIAETGFGTGLNFLVTAAQWIDTSNINSHLSYFSVEKYPLSKQELARSFLNWPQYETISDHIMENYPDALPGFHTLEFKDERITLILLIGDVVPMLSSMQTKVDCWYLDGFAPAKNPEMWSTDVCGKIADLSHSKTSFATFTASGMVRRNLQSVGFNVEKTPGFGKKREMLSGIFASQKQNKQSKTPWFNLATSTHNTTEQVVIVGGGLAGLSCAWMLSQQGIASTIVESGDTLASGASGNSAGIIMPRFSSDMNLESQFLISSYLYSIACLNRLKQENKNLLWEQSGVFQLITPERTKKIRKLNLPESFVQLFDQQQGSSIADIELNNGGIFFPDAGYVSPYQVCTELANNGGKLISLKTNTKIESITRNGDRWKLVGVHNNVSIEGRTVIFANGFDAQRLLRMSKLRLSSSRGQLSRVSTQEAIKNLKLPICDDGYMLPQINGDHVIGASYSLTRRDIDLSRQDHLDNMKLINKMMKDDLLFDEDNVSGRVSFRTTSQDHLPLVGPVPDEAAYREYYTGIQHGRKPSNYPNARYLKGLYMSTGHGSRGLATCFSSARYLTSLICGNPITWSEKTSHILHPARFIIREMKRNIDEP